MLKATDCCTGNLDPLTFGKAKLPLVKPVQIDEVEAVEVFQIVRVQAQVVPDLVDQVYVFLSVRH
jgi:hypothetical protein